MYISLNILKDFVKIPKNVDYKEIANNLTQHTVEVEGFFAEGEKFKNVVVGKVLSVEKHPNADKLNVAEVDVKKEKLQIVCGASNLEKGQLVPVSLVGAILPGDFEIKEAEIRGVKSFGMICAEDELGLGEGHEGIMVLDSKAKIGNNFADYLGLDDIVFEIDNKSLSNRPDLLNHFGIARELSAIFNWELKEIDEFIVDTESNDSLNSLNIKNNTKENCLRYNAIKIDNISVGESPQWLKNRLLALYQKPVNNIVDLTNYIMFEIGQPLHAFDGDIVDKIVVRQAKENEKIKTLDEKERILDENDIVITNSETPLAVAGIMGGVDSGVNSKTKSIILESANFKDYVVRKTSQKLNLRTEASLRYEKSLDPELTMTALKRFVFLIKKINEEAEISSSITDLYSNKFEESEINLNYKWLNDKIGQEIDKKDILNYLEKLGFKIKKQNEESFVVVVPSWRANKDIKIKEDVLEEILRLYGYDNVNSKLPYEELVLPKINNEKKIERNIKNILSLKHSLFEVYNYSFVGEDQLKKMNVDYLNHLKLANPLSGVQSILRQSLVPNLIVNIKNNQAKENNFGFFEIGNVFYQNPGNIEQGGDEKENLPFQESKVAFSLTGESEEKLFSEIKGMVNSLIKNISNKNIDASFYPLEEEMGWKGSMAVSVFVKGVRIGFISNLKEEVVNNFNLKKKSLFTELNFNTLFSISEKYKHKYFVEPSKFPSVERDLAFVINKDLLYNDISNEILNFSELITKVKLFDVYQGDKLNEDEKSLAFHISFSSKEKTLLASEVDSLLKELTEKLKENFNAKLRDF
ncbi:MAG: phenylalanine--tRNA ligase subunit beta [Patescibacteria group bacterium]|jgi:phenylalanyl-tRNA synthetase beta chain|nr:phenylalanine--tRNA ligase subunit beta [Patescibacteria group bacterium]